MVVADQVYGILDLVGKEPVVVGLGLSGRGGDDRDPVTVDVLVRLLVLLD